MWRCAFYLKGIICKLPARVEEQEMSRDALHEALMGSEWQDIALNHACKIECLESQITDLEHKLLALKIFVARHINNSGGMCHVCGAMPDEKCDAGLHG